MNYTPLATASTTVLHFMENVSSSSNNNQSIINPTSTEESRDYLFVLISVIAILALISAALTIVWLLRRSRMEKLRQHLMPMYSLEASDSGQEWEQDLLSQEVRHGTDFQSVTTLSSPCLKFNTMHSEL